MRGTFIALLLAAGTASADGTLTPDLRISSDVLGYDLQYRVYLPQEHESTGNLAVLYVTDGQWYISEGRVPRIMDRMINSGRIEPVVAVFVDSRDPDHLGVNRRRAQFPCNENYLRFYADELIPEIERSFPVGRHREKRAILGVSFGGLNAACFGLMGARTFSAIGMHSPANHPVPGLIPAYEKTPRLPLRIFLSTGNRNDNIASNRHFRSVLRKKGYPVKYIETAEEHNWDNWRPLIDDVLLFFYKSQNNDS